MDLSKFLLARIADDEAVALPKKGTGYYRFTREPYRDGRPGGRIGQMVEDWHGSSYIGITEHVARWDPARVLAECDAKRRIVERCAAVDFAMPSTHLAHGVLATLALPYADHADYREEWRP